jgi:hypothetical protein
LDEDALSYVLASVFRNVLKKKKNECHAYRLYTQAMKARSLPHTLQRTTHSLILTGRRQA